MDIKYFIIDVDGTLTDSGIYYDDHGNELKKFSTRDYAGIQAAHYVGIKCVIITGRECEATSRRMKELKMDFVFQGIKDKAQFLSDYMKKKGISKENLGYIGDDLNDLKAASMAGFIACPKDACEEMKEIADYVSDVKGGDGVVQDVFRYILGKANVWKRFVDEIILSGC